MSAQTFDPGSSVWHLDGREGEYIGPIPGTDLHAVAWLVPEYTHHGQHGTEEYEAPGPTRVVEGRFLLTFSPASPISDEIKALKKERREVAAELANLKTELRREQAAQADLVARIRARTDTYRRIVDWVDGKISHVIRKSPSTGLPEIVKSDDWWRRSTPLLQMNPTRGGVSWSVARESQRDYRDPAILCHSEEEANAAIGGAYNEACERMLKEYGFSGEGVQWHIGYLTNAIDAAKNLGIPPHSGILDHIEKHKVAIQRREIEQAKAKLAAMGETA